MQTRKRILGVVHRLPRAARALQAKTAFANESLVAQIVALIEQRSALTARLLSESAPLS